MSSKWWYQISACPRVLVKMSVLVLGTAKDLKTKVADALKVAPADIPVVPFTKE